MQMRSRDLIKNSKWWWSPSQKPYSSTLERSSKYHVISIAKKTLLMQYIGSKLFNKTLLLNYQILIFVTQFREEKMVKTPLKLPHQSLKINTNDVFSAEQRCHLVDFERTRRRGAFLTAVLTLAIV
jgi:hypothetical protein